MQLGHKSGLVGDCFKISAWQTNISENIIKLKLEKSIISLPYNHLVYIYAEETDF